ncbi:MAG: hypothetical protein L6R39_007305 [Caloplaca ligustica]|nr:MAG: hypothetical protein L6R39_007305 [Caloplaca ligustica]
MSSMFDIVVRLDRQRIHGRLRSKHWKLKDIYRGGTRESPLHEDLLAFLPKDDEDASTRQYHEALQSLCDIYKKVDGNFVDQNEDDRRLQKSVKSSSDFCTAIRATTATVPLSSSTGEDHPSSTLLQSKHLKQVEKLGRYWDLCIFISKCASRYSKLFKNTRLEIQRPYIPTQTFKPNTRKPMRCYVHAEVQLITFYGIPPGTDGLTPRVLGVSKSACYLCDLFISLHGQFFISKTHGRLYDQWTVPNLESFSTTQRLQYRTILLEMYRTCQAKVLESSNLKRLCPPESTYDFHAHLPLSPIAASTVTHLSSQVTVRGPSPNQNVQDLTDGPKQPVSNESEEVSMAVGNPLQLPPGLNSHHPQSSRVQSELLIDERQSQATIRAPSPNRDVQDLTNSPSEPISNDSKKAPIADTNFVQMSPGLNSHHPQSSTVHAEALENETQSGNLVSSADEIASAHNNGSLAPASPASSTIKHGTADSLHEHTLTHSKPYRLEIPGMLIYFESEDTKRGKVTVKGSSTTTADAIDIDAITPGDVLEFHRQDGSSCIHLDLYRKAQRPIGVDLEWLPD